VFSSTDFHANKITTATTAAATATATTTTTYFYIILLLDILHFVPVCAFVT